VKIIELLFERGADLFSKDQARVHIYYSLADDFALRLIGPYSTFSPDCGTMIVVLW
jgi:hypothetical protein